MRKLTFLTVRVCDTHRRFPSVKTLFACLVFLCGLLVASNGWTQSLFQDFASDDGISGNAMQAAIATDEAYGGWVEYNIVFSPWISSDPGEVRNYLSDVGRTWGLENLNLLAGHYGSAGSAFFLGSMNLNPDVSGLLGMTIRAQSYEQDGTPSAPTISRQWEFWGSGAFTNMDARGYSKSGSKYDGYRINRPGFLGGIQRVLSDTVSGGIMFAYSAPDMKQEGIYDYWDGGYRTTVDAKDFQYALHFSKRFGNQWEFDVFIGGGSQWLDWDRTMRDVNDDHRYQAKTTGNTVTITMYLARAIMLTSQLDMRAIVGLDSEHSWIFGFEEDGTTVAFADNHLMETVLEPYEFKKIQYSRNTLRAGLRFSHQSAHRRAGSNYQIFYGYAMDRDEVASVDLIGKSSGFELKDIKGLAVGRNSLTLGANFHVFLDRAERLVFQVDYNAILYERMTTQNVAASLALQF